MPEYDAVLIAGGGVREGGELPAWVAARFDLALAVCGQAYLMPLSAGTPHRPPPLDDRGFPITEAAAGGRYLTARGVDPRRILLEESSYDTIGNAYFSRVVHAIPREFRRLLTITSEFHRERAEAVFRWVYSLKGPGVECAVDFLSAPHVGIEPAILQKRVEKERASLTALRELQSRIRSLSEMQEWLFTEHSAYVAGERRQDAEAIDAGTY